METRLVVSTDCPTCGAPLDFSEGVNALQCGHCRSNLLVTGRRRVLSYYVEPRIEPRDVLQVVWNRTRERGWRCRPLNADLYFVPYYRLTGHDLRWESGERRRQRRVILEPEGRSLLARLLFEGEEDDGEEAKGQLRDRYVDKNFIATDLGESFPYSLGIRPAVLRLRLFHRPRLNEAGRVVAVGVTPDEALAHAMGTVGLEGRILERQVVGRRLQVIHHPFCVVELDRGEDTVLAVADGVSGEILALDAPAAVLEQLRAAPAREPETVQFRPLACPNCGWDLPVRPDDFVFYCRSCEHAWQIAGIDLEPVDHRTADVPGAAASAGVRHLPFWVLRNARPERPREFFIPAFRYRRLKILVDLARDMSGRDRSYAMRTDEHPELYGCFYDADDAARLADVTYPSLNGASVEAIEARRGTSLSFSGTELTWFPFSIEGPSLRDPFTRRALLASLLG